MISLLVFLLSLVDHLIDIMLSSRVCGHFRLVDGILGFVCFLYVSNENLNLNLGFGAGCVLLPFIS